ncbi:MAG TPA: hypothetical protein HA261_11675, partial [Methanosarcina sp.]|nr:hypothetical protein [Methanosarcina sp.]
VLMATCKDPSMLVVELAENPAWLAWKDLLNQFSNLFSPTINFSKLFAKSFCAVNSRILNVQKAEE